MEKSVIESTERGPESTTYVHAYVQLHLLMSNNKPYIYE